MTPPLTPRGLLVMRLGTLFGCTSWIVVLTAICAAKGRTDQLLPVCLPLLLASLGLGLLLLAVVEPMTDAAGPRPPAFVPRLLGAVWIAMGLLTLLAAAFVEPMLRGDPALGDLVRDAGGVLALPSWMPSLFLALGCGLCGYGLRLRGSAASRADARDRHPPR